MRKGDFLRKITKSFLRGQKTPRPMFLLSTFAGLFLLFSFGCAPPPPQSDASQNQSAAGELPDLTEDAIRERINGARVRDVPEENGTAEPITWNFDEDEPKEITVIEKQINNERATVILDIKTRSASYVRNPRSVAGQIRTFWEMETGWVLRKWEIVKTENISMKYKNLPKPPAPSPNR